MDCIHDLFSAYVDFSVSKSTEIILIYPTTHLPTAYCILPPQMPLGFFVPKVAFKGVHWGITEDRKYKGLSCEQSTANGILDPILFVYIYNTSRFRFEVLTDVLLERDIKLGAVFRITRWF